MLDSFLPRTGSSRRERLLLSIPRGFFIATLILNVLYWSTELAVDLRYTGPFYFLGVDWSRFWGAARTFVTAGPRAAYQLPAIAHAMQPFAAYYGHGSSFGLLVQGLRVGPAPYPPIFLFFFSLFTIPPPPVGFILWTALSVLLAGWVIWQLTAGLPPSVRWLTATLLLISYPMMIEFYVGQLVVLILAGLYLSYRDFQRGREFRAGLWLAALLLKPQYLVVMGLVLLFKRRWMAVAGAVTGGILALVASLLAGGVNGIVGYVRMILVDYPHYSGGLAIDPHSMITWRALIFDVLPGLGSFGGLTLTVILSILSLVALIPIWRGPWDTRSPRFHAQMLATMIVTQLVAYHSHIHGAELLFIPAVLMVVDGEASRLMQWLMAAGLIGPPLAAGLSVLLFRDLRLIGMLYIFVMVVGLILILLDQPAMPRFTQRQPLAEATSDG